MVFSRESSQNNEIDQTSQPYWPKVALMIYLTDGDSTYSIKSITPICPLPFSIGIYIFQLFWKKEMMVSRFARFVGFQVFQGFFILIFAEMERSQSGIKVSGRSEGSTQPVRPSSFKYVVKGDLIAVWVGDPVNLPMLGTGARSGYSGGGPIGNRKVKQNWI